MVTIEQIRKSLATAIKQSGHTQLEIANRLGIRQQQISCYVNEKKLPNLDTLANLCEFLDLDANEILCIRK